MNISKWTSTVLVTSIILSTLPARADTISLGTPQIWALEKVCEVYGGYNFRAYAKEINYRFGVCGVDNADDRLVEISKICATQFSGTGGVYIFQYDENQNMCIGQTTNNDHGKGNNTIGGAQENPWWNPFGW